MHKFQLLLANVVSALLIVASLTAIFIAIAPADVLKDWTITVPKGEYHPGNVISLSSTSTKLRKAKGDAHRAIECNIGKDSTVAYALNDSLGVKRLPGYNEGVSSLVIPMNIANLPATCRVIITVDYRIYIFRHTTEYAASNDFTVN